MDNRDPRVLCRNMSIGPCGHSWSLLLLKLVPWPCSGRYRMSTHLVADLDLSTFEVRFLPLPQIHILNLLFSPEWTDPQKCIPHDYISY